MNEENEINPNDALINNPLDNNVQFDINDLEDKIQQTEEEFNLSKEAAIKPPLNSNIGIKEIIKIINSFPYFKAVKPLKAPTNNFANFSAILSLFLLFKYIIKEKDYQ